MVIRTLNSNVQEVGKLIKKSKKVYTWNFIIDGIQYNAEITVSSISGKKKVKLNGDLIFECKKKLSGSFAFPFQIDVNMCSINQTGDGFELKINNHSFEELQKGTAGYGVGAINRPAMPNFSAQDEAKRIHKANQIIIESSKDSNFANQMNALKGNRTNKPDQPQQSNNNNFGGNNALGGLNTIDFTGGQQQNQNQNNNMNNFNNQFGNMNLNNNNQNNNMGGFQNTNNNNMNQNNNMNNNNNDFADLFSAFGNTGASNNNMGGFQNNANNNNFNNGFNDFNFGSSNPTNNNNQFGNPSGTTSNAFVNLNAGNPNTHNNPLPAGFVSLDDPKPKEKESKKKKDSKDDFVAPVYQVNPNNVNNNYNNNNYNNPPVQQNTKPAKEEKPKKEDKKDKKKEKEEKNNNNHRNDQQNPPVQEQPAPTYQRPSQNLAKLLGMNMDMSKIAGTTKKSQNQTGGSRNNLD